MDTIYRLYIVSKYSFYLIGKFSTNEEAENTGKQYVNRGTELGHDWDYFVLSAPA